MWLACDLLLQLLPLTVFGKTYYYKVKASHSKSSANSAYSSVKSIKAK